MKKDGFGKRIWVFIVLAEAFLLVTAGFLYSRREATALYYGQEELVDDDGNAAFYLDRSSECRYVASPEFALKKGMYTLTVQYESVGDAKIGVVHPGSRRYHSEVSGDIPLSESHTVSCDFRVSYPDRPLQVRSQFVDGAQEGDYILIREIHITDAGCAVRNVLFRIAVFLLTADGLLFFAWMRKQKRSFFEAGTDTVPVRALLLLVFVCSMPLAVDYLFLNSHDLYFHLMRIEGIRAGLEDGMFPVRIQPEWLNGHGYAASVFYGDILLYLPALLRYFGVSVQAAYKCYVVFINGLTVGIAYHSFRKMSNPKIGLACTVLYSLNLYRLVCIYTRAAVGEYTAMTFLPLILYGLWKLYTLPEDTKEHKDSWMPIMAGCTGVFLSHMISTEIAAFFILLSAVFLWKKVFRKKTMLVILKAVVSTGLLNLWFLLPFLDFMTSGTYVINDADQYGSYRIENTGAFLAQLFMGDQEVFGHSFLAGEGIQGEMPLTVGVALMAVLAGWFLLCFGKEEWSREEKKRELLAVFLCLVSLWMATCHFPYSQIADRLAVFRLPIVSIQYLWRFFSVAVVLLVWLFSLILQKEWITLDRRRLFAGLLVGISLWQGFLFMSGCLQEAAPYRVYQAGNMSTMKARSASSEEQESVMGGEYLPVDRNGSFSFSDYADRLTYDEASIQVENWEREKGAVILSLRNGSEQTQQVEVPLLDYKGYQAVTGGGEQLPISPGASCRISVAVPAGFAGQIRVGFTEPWYWRICEVLSLATLFGIFFYRAGFCDGKGKNRKKESI